MEQCTGLRNTAADRAPSLSMSDPVLKINEIPSLIAAGPGHSDVPGVFAKGFRLERERQSLNYFWRHCGLAIMPGHRVSSRSNMPLAHVSLCGSSQKSRRQSTATGMICGFGLSYLPAIMPVVSFGIVIFAALALYGARLVFLVNILMTVGEVQALRRVQLPLPVSRRATSWTTLNLLGGGPRCFLSLRCFGAFSLHRRSFSWAGLARLGCGLALPAATIVPRLVPPSSITCVNYAVPGGPGFLTEIDEKVWKCAKTRLVDITRGTRAKKGEGRTRCRFVTDPQHKLKSLAEKLT